MSYHASSLFKLGFPSRFKSLAFFYPRKSRRGYLITFPLLSTNKFKKRGWNLVLKGLCCLQRIPKKCGLDYNKTSLEERLQQS